MRIDRGTLEFVSEFVYFGAVINKNDGCKKEVENCVTQRRKIECAINVLIIEKGLIMAVVRGLYKEMLVSTLLKSS